MSDLCPNLLPWMILRHAWWRNGGGCTMRSIWLSSHHSESRGRMTDRRIPGRWEREVGCGRRIGVLGR